MIKKTISFLSKQYAAPFFHTGSAFKNDLKKIKKNGYWLKFNGRHFLNQFRRRFKKADQTEIEKMYDFKYLLNAWGINEREIQTVIKAMYIRAVAYLIVGVLGLYLMLIGSHIQFFAGILLFALGVLAFLVSIWRARVLYNGQFISFLKWVLGYEMKKLN